MTHEEALAQLDEFVSALSGAEIQGCRLAKPIELTTRLENPDDEIMMTAFTPHFGMIPRVIRELVITLTFEKGTMIIRKDIDESNAGTEKEEC